MPRSVSSQLKGVDGHQGMEGGAPLEEGGYIVNVE